MYCSVARNSTALMLFFNKLDVQCWNHNTKQTKMFQAITNKVNTKTFFKRLRRDADIVKKITHLRNNTGHCSKISQTISVTLRLQKWSYGENTPTYIFNQ